MATEAFSKKLPDKNTIISSTQTVYMPTIESLNNTNSL